MTQTNLADQIKIGDVTIFKIDANKINQDTYDTVLQGVFGENVPSGIAGNKLSITGSIEFMKQSLVKLNGPDVVFIATADVSFSALPESLTKVIAVYYAKEFEALDALDSKSLLLCEGINISGMLIDLEKNRALLASTPISAFRTIFRHFTSNKSSNDLFSGANHVLYMPATSTKEEMAGVCEEKVKEVFAKLLTLYKKNIEVAYLSF